MSAPTRVVVATEARLWRDADGRVYCPSGSSGYDFWRRYLDGFDEALVLARVFSSAARPAGAARAVVEGPGVRVAALPGYDGPRGLMRHLSATLAAIGAALAASDAAILRMPGAVGMLCGRAAALMRRPVGVEVVGDPQEVFATGVGDGAARALRALFTHDLRWHCRRADAVAYVTREPLAARYPAGAAACTAEYSSVELGDDAFVAEPSGASRPLRQPGPSGVFHIVSVGQLEQRYKGIDVLLDAIYRLQARAQEDALPPVRATIVGEGRYRDELGRLAESLGIGMQVYFRGLVSAGAGVRAVLDSADLFVLPSRTEGLPRALIEAMARGLPAIASRVGGVPALLPDDALVEPGDAAALADAIAVRTTDSAWLGRAGQENWQRARAYHADVLQPRRRALYRSLRRRAER